LLIYWVFYKSLDSKSVSKHFVFWKLLYISNHLIEDNKIRGALKMPALELAEVILAVIIGTLAAIVYSLRVLILLERRVASMEMNIQRVTSKILAHEMGSGKKSSSKKKSSRRKR